MKPNSRFILPAIPIAAALVITTGSAVNSQEMPVSPEPGATAPAALSADESNRPVREIRMLPSHKRALALKTDERNPYAKRTPEIQISENETTEESESDRIRRVLTGLVVTGRTYGPKGIRLLAGDIILQAGKEIPKVLEDQTEKLAVENLTENLVTIVWLDPETGEPTKKRLTLTYDLTPTVAQLLPLQSIGGGSGDKERKFVVIRRDELPESMAEAEESDTDPASDVTAERTPDSELREFLKQGQ